jgi:hypothetical protein
MRRNNCWRLGRKNNSVIQVGLRRAQAVNKRDISDLRFESRQ